MTTSDSTTDADLILRILRAERDRIARDIDNCSSAWQGETGYSWFDRFAYLSEQRVLLARANAAVARRL